MTYCILRLIAKGLLKLFFNPRIFGEDNIPQRGPYLIAANHSSFLDPVVISAALNVRVHWVVLKDLYKFWPMAAILKLTKCVPVNGATKEALRALNDGKVIGIFPEGTRTYDGKFMKLGKKGAALLALKAGIAVLPVGIKGTFQALPRSAKFPRLHPVEIHFGKPVEFKQINGESVDRALLQSSTEKIMDAIGRLLE